MRLRTKFLILALGTVLIPPAAVIIAASVAVGLGTGIPSDLVRLRWDLVWMEGRQATAEEYIQAFEEAGAEPTEYRIFRGSELVAGGYGETDLSSFFLLGDNAEFEVFKAIPPGEVDPVTVILRSWSRSDQPAGFRYIGFLAPLSVMIFIPVMSNIMTASINRQIQRLVKATRHIADGHMDVHLDDEGDDTFGELVQSFNAMSDRVREESAARSRFIMGVSHDLKTPLASISGYLDAFDDGIVESPEDRAKYLKVIREKTQVLDRRIRQLLDFLRLETAEWRSTLSSEDLGPLLRDTASLLELEAKARGFESSVRIPEDVEWVCLHDPDLVLRAFENLLENAFRYGESLIGFDVKVEGGDLHITLANDGPAIPRENLAFIFEPFYRASKSRRETGFGLGLSTVKSVVSSHGWTISAVSGEGRTEISIRVPAGSTPLTRSQPS